MGPPSRTPSTPPTKNLNLIPKNQWDTPAVEHLATLPPEEWVHLIYPKDGDFYTLFNWTADPNWPIAWPLIELLASLMNNREVRETHGMIVVQAIRDMLEMSVGQTWDEFDWTSNTISLAGYIEDKAWMEAKLGEDLRTFWSGVSRQGEEDWALKESIEEVLGETLEDRFGNVAGGATTS